MPVPPPLPSQLARYAIAAIGNIAVNEDNKAVVCALRGAEIIVERQASSTDVKLQETAAEVLKVFGPNVTSDQLHQRHKAIRLEDWVRGHCFCRVPAARHSCTWCARPRSRW